MYCYWSFKTSFINHYLLSFVSGILKITQRIVKSPGVSPRWSTGLRLCMEGRKSNLTVISYLGT